MAKVQGGQTDPPPVKRCYKKHVVKPRVKAVSEAKYDYGTCICKIMSQYTLLVNYSALTTPLPGHF